MNSFQVCPTTRGYAASDARQRAVDEGGTVHGEIPVTRRDGVPIWVEYSLRPLLGPDGQITGYLAVHRDVTERRLAAQRLEEQAFLLTNINDAVASVSFDSRVTYWSPSAERALGYTADEVLGERGFELLQVEYLNMTVEEGLDRLLSEGHVEVENLQHTKDGRALVMQSDITLLRNDDGRPSGALVISRDITERKRAEAEVLALRNELAADLSAMVPIARTEQQAAGRH